MSVFSPLLFNPSGFNPLGRSLSLFLINNNPSPRRRTHPSKPFFPPYQKPSFSYMKINILRLHASNLTSSVSKNVHFPTGKSIFFVSNALAHFRLSPLVPSKTFTFLQENQYFTFPCFQPTVFIHPSSFRPPTKSLHFAAGK